jgi:tetratricopeptide (TPR) repeat protein
MNSARFFVLIALIALALSFIAAIPQHDAAPAKDKSVEAARLNNLGVAYMNQQLFEKALKAFVQAAALDPNMSIAQINRGVALLNLQKIDDAKTILEKAVQTDPKDPHAWYNLGLLYKNTSDTQNAATAFLKVTGIDPDDADAWYMLGSVYAQAKQYPQAIEAFQHVLTLNPLHASGEFGLSRSLQQSGDIPQARQHLARFQYITQNKLGATMSLAYGEQGQYSRAEESPAAPEKVPAAIPVRFVDVTQQAGIVSKPVAATTKDLTSFLGPGACFLDYDGDGKIDLVVADNGPQGGLALYHNLSGGKFEDVTKTAGLDGTLHAMSCAVGDYDNDGAADFAITIGNGAFLYHNEKNGSFKDVSGDAGFPKNTATGPSFPPPLLGLTFVDYDHDGDLDLYLSSYGGPDPRIPTPGGIAGSSIAANSMLRNNGNGTFTDATHETGLSRLLPGGTTALTDYNNDRAVDIVATQAMFGAAIFENPREGEFHKREFWANQSSGSADIGVAVLDFDHDDWMDIAFTHWTAPGITLWRNNHAKTFDPVALPTTNWVRGWGVAPIDYDNDGWIDLVAVGETAHGKGEVRLFRNLGPDGFKDVTADVGLDKIALKDPRSIIVGDYDNDGASDLLITQNHGPAVLLRNEGGNKNNWLRLALKGLNDNKSAIGTKVEIFAGANRQKFEIAGSSGYLGQNSPFLTVGLGDAKQLDVVRMLWPTGVLQDEIEVPVNREQHYLEIDRRGSSCPTLFVWNGQHYELVADMLGASVVGHWVAPGERNIPRPTESIKLDRDSVHEKDGKLSFRFMEPLEESVYLDQVKLIAVDHPAALDVYPNEYFASNPPYPPFKVVFSATKDARPPSAARDDHGHDVLPDLLAHRYFGDFEVSPFLGFTKMHSLELDLGDPYAGGPLWLLMHGEIEYFSATSMYAADQAHLQPVSPYVEAQDASGKWTRVVDDLGFPAGGARTMTADLSGKLPKGTRRIRITTNLQIYWDNILIDRTPQQQDARLTPVPLSSADLRFHGFPLKIEDRPPGNVKYIYENASATGPYTRPAGSYTRYGDVRPLLTSLDDKLTVFGSGDEVALDFDPSQLPALPAGWTRDYFFVANGYEKDMDFYAYDGNYVAPMPFAAMKAYPYPGQSFPLDNEHLKYLLEYNTRQMSGNEARGYAFDYGSASNTPLPAPSK